MRIIVKREDSVINELHFSKGPIYIGRQIGSQVFLSDRAVSRQHAVLYTTTEGKWVVEDLDSANKTYLNNEVIRQAGIKDGDVLKIADFQVDIYIEESVKQDTGMSLEDTLHATLHEPQVVMRYLEGMEALPIKMPAKRGKDFAFASAAICKCSNAQELLTVLLDLLFRQLRPFHAWVGLREDPAGQIEISKGKELGGLSVKLEKLVFTSRVNDVLKNHTYILMPRLPAKAESDNKVNSAVIIPIMCENNCYGAFYVDNSLDHERYSLEDLDYMILVSIVTGAFIRNL